MKLNPNDLAYLLFFIKNACGLVIPNHKEYLLIHRLTPVIKDFELSGFSELSQRIRLGDEKLRQKVVCQLTTHETFFFRDRHPFETFSKTVLPELENLIKIRKITAIINIGPKAKIWCTAASTGQEPYSLAMLIAEYIKRSSILRQDISILATDVSADVLEKAKEAVYSQFEVERGLNQESGDSFRFRFFDKIGSQYRVKDEIRKMVDFKTCNLVEPISQMGEFDIIFSRNVLIYFDEETREKIIRQFHAMLPPSGFLFLGITENTCTLPELFKTEMIGNTLVYRKKT